MRKNRAQRAKEAAERLRSAQDQILGVRLAVEDLCSDKYDWVMVGILLDEAINGTEHAVRILTGEVGKMLPKRD
ncbi:hypothetical protein [Mesorhizobium sp. WSM3626]|uniref:hypothetical protein n=1 Tax=Mesorhizobium sp. WSM3626 TaxID=1040987 RepID=UPI00048A23A5|nr:hypothetical protein [Mesorhizobium sp. WSM3626]